MPDIVFQDITAATRMRQEAGRLVFVRGRLVALLLEAGGGWFLQHGLGPFDVEGVLFDSASDVEHWLVANMPDGWLDR